MEPSSDEELSPPVCICAVLLTLEGFVTTPMPTMVVPVCGCWPCSSSPSLLISFSFPGSWRSSSMGSFPLSLADTIVLLSLQRVCPSRNRSKQKHDENTIYGPLGVRGVIYYEVSYQKEGTRKKRVGGGVLGGLTTWWRGQGWAVPWGGVGHPGSVSVPFSLRSFPY